MTDTQSPVLKRACDGFVYGNHGSCFFKLCLRKEMRELEPYLNCKQNLKRKNATLCAIIFAVLLHLF